MGWFIGAIIIFAIFSLLAEIGVGGVIFVIVIISIIIFISTADGGEEPKETKPEDATSDAQTAESVDHSKADSPKSTATAYNQYDALAVLHKLCMDGLFADELGIEDEREALALLESKGYDYDDICILNEDRIAEIINEDVAEEPNDEDGFDEGAEYDGLGLSKVEKEQLYQAEVDDDVDILDALWED